MRQSSKPWVLTKQQRHNYLMRHAYFAKDGCAEENDHVPVKNDPPSQDFLEALVGHPRERYDRLIQRIEDEVLKSFADVERDFLDLIWCLDTYRREQVLPRGMGNHKKPNLSLEAQLAGVYRGKGYYFSAVVTELLGNMTTSRLASRSDGWTSR